MDKYYAKYELETGKVIAVEQRPEGILPLNEKPDMSKRWMVCHNLALEQDELFECPEVTLAVSYISEKITTADNVVVAAGPADRGLDLPEGRDPGETFLGVYYPADLPPGVEAPSIYNLSINNTDARVRPGQALQFTLPGDYTLRVTGPWPFSGEPTTITVEEAPAEPTEPGIEE
ncbi:MAG TPA: hypothetical protein PLK80_07340 [bacterium]|nr:hypothetical protein [bacterium]